MRRHFPRMDRTERGANQPESAGGLGRLPDQRVMKVKHVEPPHEKMMAYLDGELPEKARLQFERLLEKHPEWRVEMADMAALIGATKQLKLKPPAAKVWDRYWEEIDNKLGRQMGWALALAGALILIGFGFYKVIMYADNDFVKLGIGLLGTGMLMLFTVILRARLLELRRDRYRRIRK